MKRFQSYLLILWTVLVIFASASAVESTAVILAGIFGTPVIALLSFLWPARWELQRWRIRNIYAVPACLAILISVCMTHWPLKLHYRIVKNRLNHIADMGERKQPVTMPQQVGLIRVRKAEIYWNGITCLWTGDYPGGNIGFVRTPPDKVRFNLWSIVELDNDWQFIGED